MNKTVILGILSCFSLCFCSNRLEKKNDNEFLIAFVEDIYIDKDSEFYESNSNDEEEMSKEKFIGIFPKNNDTISIYKLNVDVTEKPDVFSFWSKNKKNKSIVFCNSEKDEIKITFNSENEISVENDIYKVNKEYYQFLEQRILEEKSIVDLAFFLKDGYGDYAQTLNILYKNWKNQKYNPNHKILFANIKNKNSQTDDQYFNYKLRYIYDEKGILQKITGSSNFNKIYINETKKYKHFTINRTLNERASIKEELFTNKITLFDSIVVTSEQYSISKLKYYTKYQSKLKSILVEKRPKNVDQINDYLKILEKQKP